MKEQPMRFSDTRLGEGTVKFEKQQLEIYTSLVKEHPENAYYKRIHLELTRQLEEDEKQLEATSEAKPQE